MADFAVCSEIGRARNERLHPIPGAGPDESTPTESDDGAKFDAPVRKSSLSNIFTSRRASQSDSEIIADASDDSQAKKVTEKEPLLLSLWNNLEDADAEDDSFEHRFYSVPDAQENKVTFEDIRKFVRGHLNSWWRDRSGWSRWEWCAHYIPFLEIMRTYNVRHWLIRDISSGFAVAAMLVPQSMSYAKLAGLPSKFGLYGSVVPVIIYALFGTSRQLGVGPVAVTSLMLGSGIPEIIGFPSASDPNNPIGEENDHQQLYNLTAIQVAFIAGIMYTSAGVFNLGFILNLLSHSVLSGFMTGASLIIGLSQTKYLFGYSQRTYTDESGKETIEPFPRQDPVHQQLTNLFSADWTPYFRWQEFIMGLSWIAILFGIKFVSQKKKKLAILRAFGPILIVSVSTLITAIGNLEKSAHIRVVGYIPPGLPSIQPLSTFTSFKNFGAQFQLAVIICIIDMIESMSIARALAASHNYEIEPSRELRGLGIANIAGSICGCYTTTGSFSRSAVNNECGAASQLAGMITGFLVMFVLLFATPLFRQMPTHVMASTVIFAVSGLCKYKEFMFLWRVNKIDWLVFTVAALTVMFLGVEDGLQISIAVSISMVLFKTAFPRISTLARLPGTNVYRNVEMYKEAVRPENGLILRIEAPLFFGNVAPVRDRVARLEREFFFAGNVLRWVVIDLSSTTEMDASAMHFLKDWIVDHRKRGIQLVFSNPTDKSLRLMERTGIVTFLGKEWIHVSVHDAVLFCRSRVENKVRRNGPRVSDVDESPRETDTREEEGDDFLESESEPMMLTNPPTKKRAPPKSLDPVYQDQDDVC